jgi:short subunit dehydrogenase-like uncharacterized protein
MDATREYDLVLLGATGFTGRLTAEYLAAHGPTGLRWALVGRSPEKLEKVRAELGVDVPLLRADTTDPDSLADVAARTKVLMTTVGPYLSHGEPVVAACAAAGTDYVDLTGEPEFVDRMFVSYGATAERTGARIVHACGFDSIPYDLGAYFTIRELAPSGPVRMRGVVRAGGTFSGGTFHSALTQFSRVRQMREAMAARRKAETRPAGRSSKAVAGKPHKDPVLGYWLVPLSTIDPFVVARSGAALEAYGPEFRYSHYAGTKTIRYAAGGAAVALALFGAAQVPPVRRMLEKRLAAGEGPDEARRAKAWFTVDLVAETDGRTLRTKVSGGDPGYGETAKMLSEAALSLAFDDNPDVAGCLTTAPAMGENLLARLIAAGIRFEVVD